MTKNKNPFSYQSANDATGFLLWKTHNYWQREIKKCLKPFNLTHTQFVILANTYWLILQNKNVTQIDIARHAEVDIMMTSNVIRSLEKKLFLLRKPHETDTRAKLVSVTSQGLEILSLAVKEVETFDRLFFIKLSNTSKFNAELTTLMKNNKYHQK